MTGAAIEQVRASSYRIPTEQPESDGTLEWDSVTVVVAEVRAGGELGIGYTYSDRAAAVVIEGVLADAVTGRDADAVPGAWWAMVHAIRNLGQEGICATAIAAVDVALWDLKARLLGVCLADLLGRAHESVPIYGSGGLTSLTDAEGASRATAEGAPPGLTDLQLCRDDDDRVQVDHVALLATSSCARAYSLSSAPWVGTRRERRGRSDRERAVLRSRRIRALS